VPLEKLPDLPVKPQLVRDMLVQAQVTGWPDPAPEIPEAG
jgi:hypothetical protein